MISRQSFPLELWLEVSSHLMYVDLCSFAMVTRQMHAALRSTILEQKRLLIEQYQYCDPSFIDDGFIEVDNAYGLHAYSKLRLDRGWHILLLDILHGRIPPAFIEEIELDQCQTRGRDGQWRHPESAGFFEIPEDTWSADDIDRLTHAIFNSPWILEAERPSFLSDLLKGDEAVAMCLIIPKLDGLRLMKMYNDEERVSLVISRIAQHLASNPAVKILGKLTCITTMSDRGSFSGWTNLHPAFLALPSVRKVLLGFAEIDEDRRPPEWPQDFPLSQADQVWFTYSRVRHTVLPIFTAGFKGPCSFYYLWDDDFWGWSKCEVGFDATSGQRTESISNDQDFEGIPSYMHGHLPLG